MSLPSHSRTVEIPCLLAELPSVKKREFLDLFASIPDQLVKAQETGKLVVFAGAGISIPSPSNVPDFVDLTKTVAEKCGENFFKDRSLMEQPDVILGRLDRTYTQRDIHLIVKQLMSRNESRPSTLHRLIPLLFRSPKDLKIVTTNYDTHLSKALEEYPKRFLGYDTFVAPALPRGNDFRGIVYLHGNTNQEPRRLVVTNRDFGRAYLTEGWARDFLRDLYLSDYTILFIGYSHKDTIVDYLARGLGRTRSNRYAFVCEGDAQRWREINVNPIQYRLSSDNLNSHIELQRVLDVWTSLADGDILEHRLEISQAVTIEPVSKPEIDNYISYCLKREDLTELFCECARDWSWLKWVEREGFLLSLFDRDAILNPIELRLARWVSRVLLENTCRDCIDRLLTHKNSLNREFLDIIIGQLAIECSAMDQDSLTRWIEIILEYSELEVSSNPLFIRTLRCVDFKMNQELLSRVIKHFFRFRREDHGCRSPSEHSVEQKLLEEFWEMLRPHIDIFYPDVLNTITCGFTESGNATKNYHEYFVQDNDRVDAKRQRRIRSTDRRDSLVRILRETITYLMTAFNDSWRVYYDWWRRSGVPDLVSLAAECVCTDGFFSSDEKAMALLENKWLTSPALERHVSKIIGLSLAGVSKEVLNELLDAVDLEIKSLSTTEEGPERFDSLRTLIRRVQWIEEAGIKSEKLKQLRREIEDLFTFGEMRDEILASLLTGDVEFASPLSKVELREMSFRDTVDVFTRYSRGPEYEVTSSSLRVLDIERLSGEFGELIQVDPEFGIGLLSQADLSKLEIGQTEPVVGLIMKGLTRSSMNSILYVRLVEEFVRLDTDLLLQHLESVSRLLERACRRIPVITERFDSQVLLLIKTLLRDQHDKGDCKGVARIDNWLKAARNSVPGRLVMSVTGLLSRADNGSDNTVWSIARDILEESIKGATLSDRLSRIVIFGQLHILFRLDTIWTEERLLPLLDWSEDSETALQCWNGFLGIGSYGREQLQSMTLLIGDTVEMIDAICPEYRLRFYDILYCLLTLVLGEESRSELIAKLADSASQETLFEFSELLLKRITAAERDVRLSIWNDWVRLFTEERFKRSSTKRLSDCEFRALSDLISLEPEFFGDCASDLLKISLEDFQLDNDWRPLFVSNYELAELFPDSWARLTKLWLSGLRSIPEYIEWSYALKTLCSVKTEKEALIELLKELKRLGHSSNGNP